MTIRAKQIEQIRLDMPLLRSETPEVVEVMPGFPDRIRLGLAINLSSSRRRPGPRPPPLRNFPAMAMCCQNFRRARVGPGLRRGQQ